jgi:hypothetical protein
MIILIVVREGWCELRIPDTLRRAGVWCTHCIFALSTPSCSTVLQQLKRRSRSESVYELARIHHCPDFKHFSRVHHCPYLYPGIFPLEVNALEFPPPGIPPPPPPGISPSWNEHAIVSPLPLLPLCCGAFRQCRARILLCSTVLLFTNIGVVC